MATSITWNGQSYSVPAPRDSRTWGASLSSYLISISQNALSKAGGTFTLTAEANFGATYGIKVAYIKSASSNISSTGIVRLANNEGIGTRNAANSADKILKVNASDNLEFDGVKVPTISSTDTLTNKTLTSPTITAPSISGSGTITTASNVVDTADSTKKLAVSLSGATTAKTVTLASAHTVDRTITLPDATDTLVGKATTDTLTNKTLTSPVMTTPRVSSGTASTVPYLDASKDLVSSAVTPTELGYVSGVSSAIQTQIDAKAPSASPTFSGTVTTPLTASRAVVTGASSELAASAVTATELGYVSGVTSAIQTQLGTKAPTASPTLTGNTTIQAAGELRLNNASDTFYTGFKSGNAAANKIWTLPLVDGSVDQVLKTDGGGTLGWATVATDATSQYAVKVGDSGGTAAQVKTNLLGKVQASYSSATFTVTIATPNVVTHNSHGMSTGDQVYLTTTGALPTGLSASTTYYIYKIDANSYSLCTTRQNAYDATKIATSGSQSGTHTVYMGGLALPITATNLNKSIARYTTAAGQSITSGGSPQIVNYGTKVYDTKAEVATGASWAFTAKETGYYKVSSLILFAASTGFAVGEQIELGLYKNGSSHSVLWYDANQSATSHSAMAGGTSIVQLNAGEYLDVRLFQSSGGTIALYAGATYNWIEVEQIG